VPIGVCSSLWVALYLFTTLTRSKLFAIQRVPEVSKGPHFHPFSAKGYARLEFWGISSKDKHL
jgi:hypothetical protein